MIGALISPEYKYPASILPGQDQEVATPAYMKELLAKVFSSDSPVANLNLSPTAYLNIQQLQQQVEQLTRRVDVQELELQFYKTQEARTISAIQYAERAVAIAFGLLPNLPVEQRHLAFYRHSYKRKVGRPAKQQDAHQVNYLNAQLVLCSILHSFIGISVHQLAQVYGIQKDERLRIVQLYDLIHLSPEVVAPADKALYDQFAPLYRLAYYHMKTQMQRDGHWDTIYEDPELG